MIFKGRSTFKVPKNASGMVKLRSLLVFMVLVAVSGCKIDSLQDTIVIADVEKEFKIDYWEELSPTKRGLVFQLETIKDGNCLNSTINYQFIVAGTKISLSLDDILTPADCVPGIAPAVATAKSGFLAYPTYDLTIDLKNTVVNKGALTANSDNYRITMQTEAGLDFVNKKLNRIPDNTFWGYVAYPDGQTALTDEWLGSVTGIAEAVSAKEGYYGHFTINNNTPQKIFLRNEPENTAFQAFFLKLNGTEFDLKSKVASFQNAHTAPVQLKVYTAWGEVL